MAPFFPRPIGIEVVADGLGFTEGPLVTQSGQVLCVSFDHGCVYRVAPGEKAVVAELGGGPNGLAEGADGRVYVAQSQGVSIYHHPPFRFGMSGGIQVIEADGTVSWLTMDPVRPNDLCFGPDGKLWVTDPHALRRRDGRIWRVDPADGTAEILVSVPWFPNGIAFGLEDDAVYVANTYEARIERFPIEGAGLGKPEPFVTLERNHPDGFAFDADGNVIVAAVSLDESVPGEVQVYDRDGRYLDRVLPGPGRHHTNVAMAADGVVYVTASTVGEVLALTDWPTAPLPLHPFRD